MCSVCSACSWLLTSWEGEGERRKREGREGMGNSNDGCKIQYSVVSSASCEVWPSAEPAEEGEGIIIYTLAYQVRIYVSEDE